MHTASVRRSELRTIVRHAVTVLAGQLAVMAYGVTDTLVAGRVSSEALAALSVGSAIYISVFVALMGVVQALLPIWAELHGAGQPVALGRSVRQALYLCLFTIAAGVIVLLFPAPLLRWTQVPPALQAEVAHYLAVLALALPAALLFRGYSTLNQSLGKPVLVTWIQIGSLAAKVPLSALLALGWPAFGIPAMGLAGCAWATVIVSYAMLLLAIWLVRGADLYRPYRIWRRPEPPDWQMLRSFARLGIPTALSITVEVTSFTLMALFIARLGTVSAASHQIASNMTAVLYMMPLALGVATSARTSYWLGAGDAARSRIAMWTGFRLMLLLAVGLALLVALARESIAAIYAGPRTEVVALAASLLAWVTLYHVADAIQCLCAFLLRCYRIAVSTFVIYGVLLWGLGLGGGYLLAYEGLGPWPAMQHPAAFWIAGSVALALTAAVFVLMLIRVSQRPLRA